MDLIGSHQFTNGKAFETYYLSSVDTKRFNVPDVDVIGLRRVIDSGDEPAMIVVRPDEALILAGLLIQAVYEVTSGFHVERPK